MNTRSHHCEFAPRDLFTLVWPTLIPLIAFAFMMRGGVSTGLFPAPLPTLDTDRTLLLHQAHASEQRHDTRLILIGDSSCLMNVSARSLNESLPHQAALNLGTLSYLDLPAMSTLLRHYVETNPAQLRTVVLLMHPEALRLPGASEHHREMLNHFYEQKDYCAASQSPLLCGLGVEVFRGRLLSRVLPQPLTGAYGQRYGFSRDLWNYLSEHRGSAIDPGHFKLAQAQGNAEYRLAARLEQNSQVFRAALPVGVRLVVGITPLPSGYAPEGFQRQHRQMLETWGTWLGANLLLTDLPAALPDELFASITHLNEQGVSLYTRELEKALASPLTPAP